MIQRSYIVVAIIALIGFAILSSLYVVDERKQAIVLQFGQVRDVKQDPGLGFKIPIIQNVVYYEDRILPLDAEGQEVTPLDDRRLPASQSSSRPCPDSAERWRSA